MTKKFLIVINCIDGRTQKPILEYMQKNFNVDYIDMITEFGPNKILSECEDAYTIKSLERKAKVSVEKHNSEIIVIAAHHDCAGNPQSEDVQKEDLERSVRVVASWNLPVKKIIALWLDENFKPYIVD